MVWNKSLSQCMHGGFHDGLGRLFLTLKYLSEIQAILVTFGFAANLRTIGHNLFIIMDLRSVAQENANLNCFGIQLAISQSVYLLFLSFAYRQRMTPTVQFQFKDIVHPCPVQLLCELYEKKALQGEVVAVTGDGQDPAGFLVVKVHDLTELVIIPVRKTSSVACP